MNETILKQVLNQVKEGKLSIDEAMIQFRDFEYKELDFAKIDNHRQLRTGYPEVIFGQGKANEHLLSIVEYMNQRENNILVTRTTAEVYELVKGIVPDAVFDPLARTITIRKVSTQKPESHIAVVSAGTSDMPVTLEAVRTAEIFDNEVRVYNDVGVAGIHRFYDKLGEIKKARVIVVVAGMEGALRNNFV